jgi:hypothetical protein
MIGYPERASAALDPLLRPPKKEKRAESRIEFMLIANQMQTFHE